MTNKRFQVDIKSNHQPVVQELMRKLGGVSATDVIGFLIETEVRAALARLDPMHPVTQPEPLPEAIAPSTLMENFP